jgi:hypothetical protein
MNRRRFLGVLAAGAIAAASTTRLAQAGLRVVHENRSALMDLVINSMREAEASMAEGFARTLYSGYEVVSVQLPEGTRVLEHTEWRWKQLPTVIDSEEWHD